MELLDASYRLKHLHPYKISTNLIQKQSDHKGSQSSLTAQNFIYFFYIFRLLSESPRCAPRCYLLYQCMNN